MRPDTEANVTNHEGGDPSSTKERASVFEVIKWMYYQKGTDRTSTFTATELICHPRITREHR